jgi:outer membrane murein-binding lipoprotein Lpp
MRKALMVGIALLLLAGCNSDEPGTDQLAAELAEVKAERDRLQAQVRTLSAEVANLKENAVVDILGCRGNLSAVVQRMNNAADDMEAKRYEDALFNLDWGLYATKRG